MPRVHANTRTDEHDNARAAATGIAIVLIASLRLRRFAQNRPRRFTVALLAEIFFPQICVATFFRLDYGVTSAATARQAFAFRDQLGERIVTRAVKSLHQSNHYQHSLRTARGAIHRRPSTILDPRADAESVSNCSLRSCGTRIQHRSYSIASPQWRVTTHYSQAELSNLIAAAEKVCESESRNSRNHVAASSCEHSRFLSDLARPEGFEPPGSKL
jgi:hypothetical protein